MDFRVRLLQALNKRKISQTRLADEVGVAKSTVSMWCNGTSTPSAYFLPMICRSLDVSADYLVGLKDDER